MALRLKRSVTNGAGERVYDKKKLVLADRNIHTTASKVHDVDPTISIFFFFSKTKTKTKFCSQARFYFIMSIKVRNLQLTDKIAA